ncbi:PAS domain S-box protein [Candidatus Bathyarchaeota archaeon]|nr:PAS domain S-box protein [Candidatus Bathyarchaeota archaeon]
MASKTVQVEKLEEKLAVTEAKYRSLVENASEGIATVDLRGRFTFVNKALCRILGYDQEELIGKPFADFLHPEDRNWIVRKFLDAWRHPRRRPRLNFRAVHRDGHYIHMYSSPSLFKRRGMLAGFQAIVSDVTDLVEAELALRESEGRLNAILGSMQDHVLAFDKNGKVTFHHSPKGGGDLLSSKGIGRKYSEVLPPQLVKSFAEAFRENMDGKTATVDCWIRARGGTRWFSAKVSPVLTECEFKGSVAVLRDVTEERRSTLKLRRLSQFLATIINNLPDMVFIKDRDLRYVLVNDSYCRFVGKPRDEILHTTDNDHFSKKEADFFREKDREVFSRGIIVDVPEEAATDLMGFVHTLHTRRAPIRDASGLMTHIVGVSRDITEQKRMERQLEESRRFSSSILQNAPNPLLVINPDTSILYSNPALERLTGYSSSELIGRKAPYPWWPQEQVEKLLMDLKLSMSGELHKIEAAFRRKNGERFWVEIRGITITGKGGLKYYISNWTDVTEQKRAEERIREYASVLTGTLESTADGILVVDHDARIIVYNKRFAELLNIPESILTSRDDRKVMKYLSKQVKDFKTFEKRTRELFANPDMESVDVFEYRNGKVFERYSRPHRIGSETAGRVISIRDITEQRRLETELRRYTGRLEELVEQRTRELESSRRFLEATMESTPDPIYIKDREFKYLFANEAYCKLLGKSREEIIGQTVYAFYPREEADILTQQDREVIEKGTVVHVPDFPVRGAYGKTRIIYTIKAPVKDPSGKVNYLIGITRDMTEIKQIEERLRRSERFRSSLLENSAYPILVVGPDSTVRYVNPAFEKMTGYTPSEVIGLRPPYPWWLEEDFERNREKLMFTLKQEKARYEMRFRRRNGELFWVEVFGVLVEIEGEKHYLSHWVDITERRQLDEMKEQFISTITHELRTPLASIKGYLEYVLEGRHGPIPEKVESSLAVVKRNTDRLVSLTNELLDLRRLQAGRLELNLESLDLREVIDQCVKEIQPLIQARLQRLQVDAPNMPILLEADRNRVAQAIANLLSNASKFTPEGGRIILSAAEDEEAVKVQVSDTGIGIRSQDLNRVFEPFTYIRKPIQTEGTGLGLSITKGMVEAHGGRIWVESAGEGRGATFTFTLPKQVNNKRG